MQTSLMIAATMWLIVAGPTDDVVRIGEAAFESRSIDVAGSTIAIVDVNADKSMDVVTAGRRLVVQLGDSAGGLQPATRVAAGENPADLAFADVDKDGHVDIIVANHDVHYITILLGDGRGGFAPAEQSPLAVNVDPHPHAIDAADVDGDGHVDVLIDHSPRGAPTPGMRRDAGGVLVMRGNVDGQFAAPGEVFTGGGVPYRGFAVGDVNGDGRPDVVLPNDDHVGVLLNTSEAGRTGFEHGEPIEATSPFMVELADFNADGHLDVIAAAGEDSARVEIFLGDGRGAFEASPASPMQLAPGGKNIALGDFNGDCITDAVVSAYHSTDVMIVFGSAESLRTTMLPGGHEHPWGLAAGDLNNDGMDDLIIIGDGAQQGRLYLSTGE